MAALPDWPAEPVMDLRRVATAQLEPVLAEETAAWETGLSWDFRPSADLVRRFVNLQALSGYALVVGSQVAGYSYYVCEDGKGLIGDLYVLREFRHARERARTAQRGAGCDAAHDGDSPYRSAVDDARVAAADGAGTRATYFSKRIWGICVVCPRGGYRTRRSRRGASIGRKKPRG
jgi:hypothetical protein